jgi:formylglycine-generating enzyme required for sulfatase activity
MVNKFLGFVLLLFFLVGCSGKKKFVFEAEVVYPPVATMQLGPSIFLSGNDFEELDITEGTPVRVTVNNKVHDLRIYNGFGKEGTFGIHKKYLKYFDIEYNKKFKIILNKINSDETDLKPKPIKFSVENYHGNLNEWKRYAFGAPHGDCDFETGTVVKKVTELYGIPSTAAYGCRLSYRGIWYDCNRPLMKKPKPGGYGVIPERQWNGKAIIKYRIYQDSVWANNKMHYGERFKLFTSFHGHDLTVKLPDGKRIQRPVIEGIGVGFSKNNLRRIKKFYYDNRNKYYKNPPDLYFGNLPEDLVYEYEGVPLTFFYSGLGTRTYGSLRSDLVEHALHFETPNSMRVNPDVQPVTARLLHDLYCFVKDSIFTNEKTTEKITSKYTQPKNIGAKAEVSGGEFLFGAPPNFGWSSERPQNKVTLSPFQIDIYEVTNQQYCDFLNEVSDKNMIKVVNGDVYTGYDIKDERLYCRTYKAIPFSEIDIVNEKFVPRKGRENFPVVFVTYYGAKAYAESKGESLPTEAEWEYAASWDGSKKYLYGTSCNIFKEEKANYEDTGDPYENADIIKTTPVGFYQAQSPSGCKDMSGNVWEWCEDYYISDVHKKLKDKNAKDPLVTEKTTMKVIKGGAWNTEGPVTSVTKRLGISPDVALINLGFRCVKR